MASAILSLTDPPGLQPSSYAHISASAGPHMRRILTIGVLPISERTSGWSFMIFLPCGIFFRVFTAPCLIISYAGITDFQKKILIG
jgi:hypothetical protein